MTADPLSWAIVAAASLAALMIVAHAALRGWHDWLDVRRLELTMRRDAGAPPGPAARIDVADLKERVRKLEAIAAGVDV